jgi:uncharacterized membrane protein
MIHVLHAATLQTPPHFGQNKLRLQGCGCVLYGVTGCFWLPVVWMQMRMRDLAEVVASKGLPLPPAYHRPFWTWFAFGFSSFSSVLGILGLMLTRPRFRLFL